MKNSKLKIFTNGIFKENPVLILLLGCCSVLAISVTISGALGMGAALTFVLVGSNVVISLLRKIIPDKIRIPCFIGRVSLRFFMRKASLRKFVKALLCFSVKRNIKGCMRSIQPFFQKIAILITDFHANADNVISIRMDAKADILTLGRATDII